MKHSPAVLKNLPPEYWKENYAKPLEMDNIGNRKIHVNYLKNFLALESYDVSTVADFGFGLGHLFYDLVDHYKPYKAYGLEPSTAIFSQSEKKLLKLKSKYPSMNFQLENLDLVTYAQKVMSIKKPFSFDLGICTSVFQYLSSDDLPKVIEALSRAVKILYFSVPTDLELKSQREDVHFVDENAISRSREEYVR